MTVPYPARRGGGAMVGATLCVDTLTGKAKWTLVKLQ